MVNDVRSLIYLEVSELQSYNVSDGYRQSHPLRPVKKHRNRWKRKLWQ